MIFILKYRMAIDGIYTVGETTESSSTTPVSGADQFSVQIAVCVYIVLVIGMYIRRVIQL